MNSFEVPCHYCALPRVDHYDTDHKFVYMHISSGPVIDVTPDGVEVVQEAEDDSNELTLDKLRKVIKLMRANR